MERDGRTVIGDVRDRMGEGDEKAFLFPGQGKDSDENWLTAKYAGYIDLGICAIIFDDLSVYLGIDGGKCGRTSIYGWHTAEFWVSDKDWSFEVKKNHIPHDDLVSANEQTWFAPANKEYWDMGGEHGVLSDDLNFQPESISSGWVGYTLEAGVDRDTYMKEHGLCYVGNLGTMAHSYEADHKGEKWDASLYILGGSLRYDVDHGQTIYPYKMQISGLLEYLDYYPWAIKDKNGAWLSCNREGGWLKARENGWEDRKNQRANDETLSTVFMRDKDSWHKCQEYEE